MEAIPFALGVRREGYHLYVMGPPRTGKRTLTARILRARAEHEPAPEDLCYVHNFADPVRPRALRVPAGTAFPLRRDFDDLVADVRASLPAAFRGEEYRTRRQKIESDGRAREERAFAALQESVRARGYSVERSEDGILVAAVRDGKVLKPQDFETLPEAERVAVRNGVEQAATELRETLRRFEEWGRELRTTLEALAQEIAARVLARRMEPLRARYQSLDSVLKQLAAVEKDLVENAEDLFQPDEEEDEDVMRVILRHAHTEAPPFARYRVNVLVAHEAGLGAPIVHEEHPTHVNLLGRVEHLSELGGLVTDFNLIRAGALHRANGGYLVLDARLLLEQPFAWEGLKRALRTKAIRTESIVETFGLVGTITLEPEPVALDVKVVLLGNAEIHARLSALDPEFSELFKVVADFEDRLERTHGTEARFASLAGSLARREGMRPFDRGALARIVEQAARLAEDAERLSLRMGEILDVMREADFFAARAGAEVVGAEEVQSAVNAEFRRAGGPRQRLQDEIRRGTLVIDTRGTRLGQVNGIAAASGGRLGFGFPTRITARVRAGRGELVDIAREVRLGGPIHSKGVMILAGFLGERYARRFPLTLSASLVFEQTYGPIEGDSAQLAELLAILSALAEAPVDQSLAVTGAVDQHGRVLAVGGVNEKIEGFFDVCRAAGAAACGVVIPAANVKNLMLRRDVVEAAVEGRLRIHAVASVDEALEIVTGRRAGVPGARGRFARESLNARIESRLAMFARLTRRPIRREVQPEPRGTTRGATGTRPRRPADLH